MSSLLYGCARAKLGPLGRRNLHHLMFVTKLFLGLPVRHMDPHITDWAVKPSHVSWEFEQETFEF